MLIVLEHLEINRVYGASREEVAAPRRKIPQQHHIHVDDIKQPPYGTIHQWNAYINNVLYMLREGQGQVIFL